MKPILFGRGSEKSGHDRGDYGGQPDEFGGNGGDHNGTHVRLGVTHRVVTLFKSFVSRKSVWFMAAGPAVKKKFHQRGLATEARRTAFKGTLLIEVDAVRAHLRPAIPPVSAVFAEEQQYDDAEQDQAEGLPKQQRVTFDQRRGQRANMVLVRMPELVDEL